MNAAFLAFLTVHAGQALLRTWRHRDVPAGGDMPPTPQLSPLGALLHVPLMTIAVYYGIQEGAWNRDLVSPIHIGLGLVIGHIIFSASTLITHQSMEDAWETLKDIRDLWRFIWESPNVLSRYLTVGVGEEIIWRMAAQPMLIGLLAAFIQPAYAVTAGIVVIAILFTVCHDQMLRKAWPVKIEFVLFSLLLGVIYHVTGSLALVIIIHTLRDIEIVYGEFAMKVYEWGDKERALDHIERSYSYTRPQAS